MHLHPFIMMGREVFPKQAVSAEGEVVIRNNVLCECRISMHQIDHLSRCDPLLDLLNQRVDKLYQHWLQLANVRKRQKLGECVMTQLVKIVPNGIECHFSISKHAG